MRARRMSRSKQPWNQMPNALKRCDDVGGVASGSLTLIRTEIHVKEPSVQLFDLANTTALSPAPSTPADLGQSDARFS